ncbi:glycosyltransferase family 2 protein [Brevundimonas sp.]|uniref:glycosyltransferase family 2 protein n=1 Tax=Brevundimonas sp. TaxID=1871086 RepID=UPI002D73B424|nr:glycosyltransferase family 2 protein [Brevundimonas sp.]HYC73606.1 glycosyltransferase family 2 protein [Brevundimonas sp.]
MKTLSLITASYNSARTIGDTLRSVNAQTYPAIEYLVVDGGSKDYTMTIVASEGQRVTSAVSEPDKGIYDAYNKGLSRATGEVIGFINSDDYYCAPDVLENVMKAFDDPTVEAVHADLVYVDPENTGKIERHWKSRPATVENLRRGFIPAHPTLFLTRAAYDKVGEYDTRYRLAADYDFMLRAFYVHKLKSVYVPQIWVRMRSGGATGGTAASIMKQNDEIRASQAAHGLNYPKALFFAHKVLDRSVQRARAPFVKAPDIAGTAGK